MHSTLKPGGRRVAASDPVPVVCSDRGDHAEVATGEGLVLIERVPSAYPAKTPRRDAGADARITTVGLELPQSTGASFHAVTSGTAWLRVDGHDPL